MENTENLQEHIDDVLKYMDPKYPLYDFVKDRLTNLEGTYEQTNAPVIYFKRKDLDITDWEFCYNLVIPLHIDEDSYFDDDDETDSSSIIYQTLMLDICRNRHLISEQKPSLVKRNDITRENIKIGGFEVFFAGLPQVEIKK